MLRDPGDPETSPLVALHHRPPVLINRTRAGRQPHDLDSWYLDTPGHDEILRRHRRRHPPCASRLPLSIFFRPPATSRRPSAFREGSQGRNNPLDWIDRTATICKAPLKRNICRLIRPLEATTPQRSETSLPTYIVVFPHAFPAAPSPDHRVQIGRSVPTTKPSPRTPSRRKCNHTPLTKPVVGVNVRD